MTKKPIRTEEQNLAEYEAAAREAYINERTAYGINIYNINAFADGLKYTSKQHDLDSKAAQLKEEYKALIKNSKVTASTVDQADIYKVGKTDFEFLMSIFK